MREILDSRENKVVLPPTEARILRALSTRVPTTEAQRIFRRGLRIATLLNSGPPDDDALEFICDALAQEGGLVQELVEELLLRIHSRPPPGRGTNNQEPGPTSLSQGTWSLAGR